MTHKLLIATACALALGACQTTSNTAVGALGGAAAGAALGTLVGGNDRRNAIVGAGIGLIAGTAAGAYMDRQREALARDLAGSGADIRAEGERLTVTLPSNITFDTDSAQINPGFTRTLSQVAGTLRQYPQSYIDIIGHTDDTGSVAYNQDLSERRAFSVADFISARGVRSARIAAYGEGETRPIATNATSEGRRVNRRVEMVITPAREQG
ncbi:MAG: OmpA family protein [Pseudomonadota bacterium]